ncbi:MAG: tetratricopeptide repeat protein [Planctomycetota bacterium]
MRQWAYFIFISVITVICVCFIVLNMRSVSKVTSAEIELEQYKQKLADLEKAGAERDLANQKIKRLETEISSLLEQRKTDLRTIETLRESLRQKDLTAVREPPAPKQNTTEQVAVEQIPARQSVEEAENITVKYDADMLREMITSADGLQGAVREIVTSEGIDSTLQEHDGNSAHWVAAASLAQDPETKLAYLEEAAALFPNSSMAQTSLVEAHIAQERIDESTMAHIEQMKMIDPTNALADCYAAYVQYNSGDIDGALQSLLQASVKDRFVDDSIDLLMARKDYFLNEGCSESVALGLSAFDLPLSHMGMLREIGDNSMAQAEALYAAGQYEDALQIVTNVSKLGGTLSSSGRFVISDRVGMTMQISASEKARQIYEALGDVAKVAEIDSQLQAVQERSDTIDIMVQAFGGVLQNMDDQGLADYVNGTILNGEFSTLQNIPEIAEALELARKQKEEVSEMITP